MGDLTCLHQPHGPSGWFQSGQYEMCSVLSVSLQSRHKTCPLCSDITLQMRPALRSKANRQRPFPRKVVRICFPWRQAMRLRPRFRGPCSWHGSSTNRQVSSLEKALYTLEFRLSMRLIPYPFSTSMPRPVKPLSRHLRPALEGLFHSYLVDCPCNSCCQCQPGLVMVLTYPHPIPGFFA